MTTTQTHASLDTRLGPLVVGELRVERTTLVEMGARVLGMPVSPDHLKGREADQTLIDLIRFPEAALKQFLGLHPALSDSSANLLFEFASLRSMQAPLLMQSIPNEALKGSWRKLDSLLNAVQRINLHQTASIEGAPPWADVAKSRACRPWRMGCNSMGTTARSMRWLRRSSRVISSRCWRPVPNCSRN